MADDVRSVPKQPGNVNIEILPRQFKAVSPAFFFDILPKERRFAVHRHCSAVKIQTDIVRGADHIIRHPAVFRLQHLRRGGILLQPGPDA